MSSKHCSVHTLQVAGMKYMSPHVQLKLSIMMPGYNELPDITNTDHTMYTFYSLSMNTEKVNACI